MTTKTWKLGEMSRGGIITVEVKGSKVIVFAKDWDTSAGYTKKSNQKNAKVWNSLEVDINNNSSNYQLNDFLNDLTTSYYADKIMKWIESKLNFSIKSNWF